MSGFAQRAIASVAELLAGTAGKLVDAAVRSNTPCFSAHKNGTDQTGVADITVTPITFGTELYDVGSYFASSAWTPPAGKVHLNATVAFTATISAGKTCALYIVKNGSTFLGSYSNPFANAGGGTIALDDIANGTDVYTISLYLDLDSGSGTVTGAAGSTRFSGHWICP